MSRRNAELGLTITIPSSPLEPGSTPPLWEDVKLPPPGPLTPHEIAAIPTVALTEELPRGGSCTCTICMEHVPLGTRVIVLPCNHWYHDTCISTWFLLQRESCPTCRRWSNGMTDDEVRRARYEFLECAKLYWHTGVRITPPAEDTMELNRRVLRNMSPAAQRASADAIAEITVSVESPLAAETSGDWVFIEEDIQDLELADIWISDEEPLDTRDQESPDSFS